MVRRAARTASASSSRSTASSAAGGTAVSPASISLQPTVGLAARRRSRHWFRFERAYLILAALATPLVLSVHSVVSFDFATSQLAGWHTTIFPPYFVAGAIFGGFAMVLTLSIPARQ